MRTSLASVLLAVVLGAGGCAQWMPHSAPRDTGSVAATPEPAQDSFPYHDSAQHYVFSPPLAWHTQVRIMPLRGAQLSMFTGAMSAVDFRFEARGVKGDQSLLSLAVFNADVWAQLRNDEHAPPAAGVEIARLGHRVLVAALPDDNPYAPGSMDAQGFAARRLDQAGVRNAIVWH